MHGRPLREISFALVLSILILSVSAVFIPQFGIRETLAAGITHVTDQYGRGTGSGASISVTMNLTPTNGNLLVACIAACSVYGSVPSVTSIVESGVVWTEQIQHQRNTQFDSEIWVGVVGSSASKSVTVNLSPNATYGGVVNIYEYSGLATSGFLDKTATNDGDSTTSDTGTTATTTYATELWVGSIYDFNFTQSSPTNGFTLYDGAVYSFASGAFLEKIVSSTGTANSGTTLSSSTQWVGCIATFATSGSSSPVTPQAGYAFTLAKNSTSNYVLAENGSVLYSNVNPVLAFSQAADYSNETDLYVKNGTYTASTSFSVDYLVDEVIDFNSQAWFTIANGVNNVVLRLDYCNNVTLRPNIDGNSENQDNAYYCRGILLYDCGGCVVRDGQITHAVSGFDLGEEHYLKSPNGCENMTITFCDWNGATLGFGSSALLNGTYMRDCEIAYSSNVGISIYGSNYTEISNCYIHDMNGTTGGVGGNAQWGIAPESNEARYTLIINNTLVNCEKGVVLADGESHLVKGNNLTNCNTGIYIGETTLTSFSILTDNYIKNWTYSFTWQDAGIFCHESYNDIISFNTLINNNATASKGIWLYEVKNSTVANNTVTLNTAATSYGVKLEQVTNHTIVSKNNVQAKTGVSIGSGCVGNKIDKNTLTNCTTGISNSGSGTIIDPSSCANYALTLNNMGNGQSGRYQYSNSSTILITVYSEIGTSAVLNIDGENVSLVDWAYSLAMSYDHFAYTLYGYSSADEEEGITPVLSILLPQNLDYGSSSIPVQIMASGGTIDVIWFNCKNGSSWVFPSNETYTVTTTMAGFLDGIYTLYAWANNTEGNEGFGTNWFMVVLSGTGAAGEGQPKEPLSVNALFQRLQILIIIVGVVVVFALFRPKYRRH